MNLSDMRIMTGPEDVAVAGKLFEGILQATSLGMRVGTPDHNPAKGLHIAANAVTAAAICMSAVLQKPGEDIPSHEEQDCLLVALLMTARMSRFEDGGVNTRYDGLVIAEAVKDFEKLYGRSPLPSMNPDFARVVEAEAALRVIAQSRALNNPVGGKH